MPASRRLKLMVLKKGWRFTSAAPSAPQPSRCWGSLARSWGRGTGGQRGGGEPPAPRGPACPQLTSVQMARASSLNLSE